MTVPVYWHEAEVFSSAASPSAIRFGKGKVCATRKSSGSPALVHLLRAVLEPCQSSMAYQACLLLRVDLPWAYQPTKPTGMGKDDPIRNSPSRCSNRHGALFEII